MHVCVPVLLVRNTCFQRTSTICPQRAVWWALIGWMKLSDAAEGHLECVCVCVCKCQLACVPRGSCFSLFISYLITKNLWNSFSPVSTQGFHCCHMSAKATQRLCTCACVCACAASVRLHMCPLLCWRRCPCRLHAARNLCSADVPSEGGLWDKHGGRFLSHYVRRPSSGTPAGCRRTFMRRPSAERGERPCLFICTGTCADCLIS